MRYKKIMMLTIIVTCLLAVSAVSAADDLTGDIVSVYDQDNNIISEVEGNWSSSKDSNVLNANPKTFTDLNNLINGSNKTDIYLDCNYIYNLDNDSSFKKGISINNDIIIHGNGFTIDGGGAARIFSVSNNKVVFRDVVFVNGKSSADGGAIYGFSSGSISVVNCSFINNSAGDWGGAICGFSFGLISVVNCSFSGNSAPNNGGAIYGSSFSSISVVNCSFSGNSAPNNGGAIYGSSSSSISVVNCSFSGNSAKNGGAINNKGTMNISSSSFVNNSAGHEGGAIDNNGNIGIYGSSFVNNSASYGGAINNFKNLSVYSCGFVNNYVNMTGGGIYSGGLCHVVDSGFVNNSASYGGALYNGSAVNCTFINNSAQNYGGALCGGSAVNCTFMGNSAQNYGGAIYGSGFSSISVVNCNFINNSASGDGGAIYGFILNSISVVNCNFINNSASGDGGAIYGSGFSSISVVNCSFSGNSAKYGGAINNKGNMNISSSSFVNNSASYGGAMYGGSVVNCTFIENSANCIGGAAYSGFFINCIFTRNSALWEAGAAYKVSCVNCSFTENYADYGGAMKEGLAENCIFTGNCAIFGGASYKSTSVNCSFTENYADYGGALYGGLRSENCSFIKNFADFGGAIYGINDTANACRFINNTARNGGATYQVRAKNCYFEDNEATENGGAMYGESAANCVFKDNKANNSGNDTFNTVIADSLYDNNIIYFDASAPQDGDGSENNPYKYLYPSRLTPGVIAYFEKGIYYLNDTCLIAGAKLIGKTSDVVIKSKVSNQYDFIVKENSYLELNNLQLNNIHILNQATVIVRNSSFEGNDVFDLKNLPEIESGSDLFDSSYGGVIVCDVPSNVRSRLILEGCNFEKVYDAFNGGVIAAVNSDIFISNTVFMHYSATYKGGAIYCINSNLNIHDSQFTPYTVNNDEDSYIDRYNTYTSYYGGSIYCENCDMYISQSNFNGSVSFSFGGCIASLNSHISIEKANFYNSLSLIDGGGAIYNSKSELSIFNSIFDGNGAEFGGAICNINSILDSHSSTYRNNSANYYGGVIYDIYGTLDFSENSFHGSHALVGGSIYTRIPNSFNSYSNNFENSFAQEGSSIFFDGKKESLSSYLNSFGNKYHIFVEFSASLNGEEYYLISNPLYYQISSETGSLYLPYSIFEVNDGLVSMVIYDNDDGSNMTSIVTDNMVRNVSAKISFSKEFDNPVLHFYLLEDNNIDVFFDRKDDGTNVYAGSRDELFDGHNLIKTYSISLSDRVINKNYDLTEVCTIDLRSIQYDNIYEANSFYPVSLINSSIVDSSAISSNVGVLPSYYNSNDYGFVSSVKDQKNGGNCWAFAGLATLETCLKKATGVTYDFSEENAKNLMAAYSVYGVKIETNFGGYDSMMMSYLTSWLGPINESTENYDDYSSISVLENPMFHIQNIKFLPARLDSSDNDLYKLAIMDYGAVSVIFKWDKDYHAVSLVGWDDNYKGYDSLGNKANGAWIFKNSFGEDWENNGFGYLSYNQKISEQIDPSLHAYAFIFNDANPYSKIYQYDFAGVSQFYHYLGSIYFKNTFVAEDDSLLSAFSTYFDTQTDYTVSVYVNDQFVFAQNGTSSAGYYTIRFNNSIQLDKGDKFTIEVHNHNSEGYSCIPLCYAEDITKKTFSENVSFVSLDGETWYDLYDYADSCHVACIKAFTQNINLKSIKINANEIETVDTHNFNVKVSFDDFNHISSINYCLLKFTVDGKDYYAQIKDGVACLNLKLEDGIHSLSAQYKDNVFESNLIQFNFTVDTTQESYSFNAIQDMVDNASDNSIIVLNNDYSYDEYLDDGDYGIHIDKAITINGNGHVLDGLNKATAFYIASDNVVLNDIVFVNTYSLNGGGIFVAGRNVTLNNCIFINSSANQSGGAIYSLFNINLNNCQFINDSANMGGGLYLISTETSHIQNSCFVNNTAALHGSAIYMLGVGDVLVSSTNFTSNTASYNGGAVFSSVYLNNFTDCNFADNHANSGGAVFSNARVNEFVNCNFSNNFATVSGGAINAYNIINVYDSDFINNSVTGKNLLYNIRLASYSGGGAITSYDDLNIYNSNFINNHVATSGGALYTNKYLNIYNSTFINNSASKYGGAIYNTPLQMIRKDTLKMLFESMIVVTKFTESNYYDSTFIGNHAETGGAIYNSDLVENCTFINNSASDYGGAIFSKTLSLNITFVNLYQISGAFSSDTEGFIANSSFVNNSANYGGAILNVGEMNIYSCNFTRNYANKTGAGIYSKGTCHVDDSYFVYNSANECGGAINNGGNIRISSSSFVNNSAHDNGGAIWNGSAVNCSFVYNSAEDNGGAIWNGSAVNCSFVYNSAIDNGGAIWNGSAVNCSFMFNSAGYGGAIWNGSAVNCSFVNNSAFFNGGAIDQGNAVNCSFMFNSVRNNGGAVFYYGEGSVVNCTFIGNSAEYNGGAFFSENGGSIVNSSFVNNSADYNGGAIANNGGNMSIFSSSFVNNSADFGGAILSFGDISAYSCEFANNCANRSGGAIYSGKACYVYCSDFVNNSANHGGAIYSDGKCHVDGSDFVENGAANAGGAIFSKSEGFIVNSSFVDNSARYGGAIDNLGNLSVYSSDFVNDYANKTGGVIYSEGPCYFVDSSFVNNSASYGGAIFSSMEGSIVNSSFVNNSVSDFGGAILSYGNMNISSSSFTDNSAHRYGGAVDNDGNMNISSSSFVNNSAGKYGGAVDNDGNMNISSSSFVNNSVGTNDGGAVENDGNMSIFSSSFVNNFAARLGGAVENGENMSIFSSSFVNNSAGGDGGAVDNGGNMSIFSSSFVNNSAGTNDGGAVDNWGIVSVFSSSFVNNSAGGNGGAIWNGSAMNCIFINNSAGGYGGAMYNGSADCCIFENNTDSVDGDDTYSTEIFKPVLSGSNFISTYKSGDKLIINFTNSNGIPIVDADVTISVYKDDALVGTYYCLSGDGWVVDLETGNYIAVVSVDSRYLVDPIYANMTILKSKTNICVEDVFVEYGGDATLTAILINEATGQPIKGANVKFTVDGEKYSVKTDASGQAKLTISGLTPDTYKVTVSYGGNGKYNSSAATADIVVSKIATSVSLYYDKTTGELVATLINSGSGKGISGANVVFNLNGVKTAVKTNKLGEARLSIGDVDPDNFNAGISYGGNSKYLKSTGSIRIAEGKIPNGVSNTYNRETGEVIATLINADTGIAIKGATVVFNINGVKTALKTDKLGQVRLSVADLSLGVNSIGSSYGGNFKYSGSTTSINIVKI